MSFGLVDELIMDPDVTWTALTTWAQLSEERQQEGCPAAAEDILALDEWLRRGGFPPQVWRQDQ